MTNIARNEHLIGQDTISNHQLCKLRMKEEINLNPYLISMYVSQIINDKKQYLELLLLADEQESMIDRYLERGDMFVLDDDGVVKAVGVVTDEGNGVCELKNIAVAPDSQRQGYGKKLINYLIRHYSGKYNQMIVGTGDVPSSLEFYRSCGFEYSHRIENFFIDNYDHLMIEEGVLLKDMVYLKQMISAGITLKPYYGRIPACGVFCGGCPTYTREKNPCRGAELNRSRCEKCKTFHLCCVEKGVTHCFECDSFPCSKFKGFAKRWLKHGQDFIENQQLLKQMGEVGFLRYYNEKVRD